MKDDIQTAMEYTKKYMETVTPTGFSVTYDDEGTGTVALAFKKKFRSGQVKGYSCPQKRQRTDHTENGSTFMDDDQWARVRVVLQAAERYIEKGERAQTEH